jgi:hypothetical protein
MATPNALFVSGAILTAAQQNDFPFGFIGTTNLATSFNTASLTAVDVTGLTVSFTALASRKYLVVAVFNLSNTTNVPAQAYINNGATALSEVYYGAIGAGNVQTVTTFAINTPGAGAVTYKAQALTTGGTLTVYGTSTRASLASKMYVLDIGTA